MRVKQLELFGFKSFATKTSIQFERGVTAVVGPNGVGKSNICDSIRWVLGEHNPRDVRAPRLEDVIFNGTDTKAPLSMAEVTLTIENEEGLLPIAFSEVQITRRVFRSGESECFINQSPCRLKDVQELFLGTGLGGGAYAIIEQGHIDMILSSKPEERRAVFEEASGIARYLTKKQETMRKLDDVEQDLVRVADIIQEVRRQLSALERQAAKARQYKTHWEQLKSWELRLAADELKQGQQTHEQLSGTVGELTQQRQTLEAERQQMLEALERHTSTVTATQATLQDLRTKVVETASQIEQHASQLSLKSGWVEELTQQRQQLELDEAQLQGRMQQVTEHLTRLTEHQTAREQQRTEALAQQTALDQELARLEAEQADGAKILEEGKTALFAAASESAQQRNMLADIVLRLRTVGVQAAKAKEQRAALEKRLEALMQRRAQLEEERRTLSEQQDALQRHWTEAAQQAAQANEQQHALMGRLSSAREQLLSRQATAQLKGFPESVNTLLADPHEGVLGLLVELAVALGQRTFAVVVKDRQALHRCRDILTAHQLDGVPVVALSDMEQAEQRGKQAAEEMKALELECAALQQSVDQTESQRQARAAEEQQARSQAERLAPSLTKLEGQVTQSGHETTRAQEELAAAQGDHEELLRQERELTASHERARQQVVEAEQRQQHLEQQMKAVQRRLEDAAARKQQQAVSAAQLEAAVTSLAQRQEELRARLAEAQSQQQELTEQRSRKQVQSQELSGKIADLTRQLEDHRSRIPSLTDSKAALQHEADRIAEQLRQEEAARDQVMPSLLAAEQELMTLTQTLKDQETQLAERTFRRTRILERLQEVYRLDEAQILAQQHSAAPMTDEERQSLMSQVERLKTKLEAMGPVSLGSVEEYDQLKGRLEFLQAQQQDLLKAQEDLRRSIQQINRTARSQFRETFAKAQQEFQRYFARLFNGGQADLILVDEEDVLESGIEIMARPPGKRPQSITLLSGGERALTATALLFALFKVRPSPFCILDEIDAPLDEANVDRFTKVLEEFLNLSQFILITHNKKTITKADCMYGVTMEQAGMSKIVSVKFAPPRAHRRELAETAVR